MHKGEILTNQLTNLKAGINQEHTHLLRAQMHPLRSTYIASQATHPDLDRDRFDRDRLLDEDDELLFRRRSFFFERSLSLLLRRWRFF